MTPIIPAKTFDERCKQLIDHFASREAGEFLGFKDLIEVAARLYADRDVEEAIDDLREILRKPRGDMFWMVPIALVTYVGRTRFPDDIDRRITELWRDYAPNRGDTENHWAMYYCVLYLLAQLHPDMDGSFWFNGRSSEENRLEAAEYLDSWIQLTLEKGQGEFDSPHYIAFFVAPLALLYAFCEDPEMKRKAGLMLDLILADFAAESLNGLYAGAFSRIYPEPLMHRWKNGSTTLGWLVFGNVPFRPDAINVVVPTIGYRPHGVAFILAISGWKPSQQLIQAATDRSRPYLHRELKRTRFRIRYSEKRTIPVYKTTFMTKDFALGSIQGGLIQPIQQHSWELFWAEDDVYTGHNLLFSIHPFAGELELGMYFPEEPKLLTEGVVKGEKPTYDQPDKWTGSSPYEHIFQHCNTLIVLYDIPPGTRFPHVSAYFSRRLREMEEDASGWIFARAGRAFVAYFPLADFEWRDEGDGDRRLHSEILKNGAVVHVAQEADYATYTDFRSAFKGRPPSISLEPTPSVEFTAPNGDVIRCTYGETPSVNGEDVDFASWPLFDGPFVRSVAGSGRVEVGPVGDPYVIEVRR
ncbi:MAG TPA: hypothetical protein VMO47_18625 [Rhodothermales bacterium]|nr:hypothetical protein [Rhodothermales bacterium]